MDSNLMPLGTLGSIDSAFLGYQSPVKCTDDTGGLFPYVTTGDMPMYYSSPAFKDYMTILQRWVKDGLVDTNSWLTSAGHDQAMEKLRAGKYGALVSGLQAADIFDYLTGTKNPLPSDQAPENWVCVTNMRATSGQYLTYSNSTTAPLAFVGITKNRKDPDAAVKVIDWLAASQDNNMLANFGREGTEYTMTDGKLAQTPSDGDTPLYSGMVGYLGLTFFHAEVAPMTMTYVSQEWRKFFDPENHWYVPGDAGILYTLSEFNETDGRLRDDFPRILRKNAYGKFEYRRRHRADDRRAESGRHRQSASR